MLWLRKGLFWAHLAVGVVCGAVVLMMAVTGVLLTYEKQIEHWADREHWVAPTLPGHAAPVDELVRSASAFAAVPGASVTHLTRYADPAAPVAARLDGGRTLYLDPSNATVRGEPSHSVRDFFSWTTRIHRWFGVQGERRSLARSITGWSNALFLFLILSGLYLWMPRRWSLQHLRPRAWLNRGTRGRARDFNWHHAFGFWSAVPLFVVVFSATSISFPGFRGFISDLVDGEPPAGRIALESREVSTPISAPLSAEPRTAEGIDAAWLAIPHRIPGWRSARLALPEASDDTFELRIERGWGGEPNKGHTLVYDRYSGTELSHTTFSDLTNSQRMRSFFRFAHTGEFFGLIGQTVAGLVSLAGAILVWTGLALTWRRLKRNLRNLRRSGRNVPPLPRTGAHTEERAPASVPHGAPRSRRRRRQPTPARRDAIPAADSAPACR